MNKKQMRHMMVLPVLGLAALCVTRCAHAKDVSELDSAIAAILAAKATWVVAYAAPLGKSMDARRYNVAKALCYAPNNEIEILRTAVKLQDSAKMPLSTAIGITVVAECNRQLLGRAI